MIRNATIIALLTLVIFCFMNVDSLLCKDRDMQQERYNRLKSLTFIQQRGLIVGACDSEPNGGIRFWSADDGKLREVLDLGRGERAVSAAVSNNGHFLAAALFGKKEIVCYSLVEGKWLWRTKWVEVGVLDTVIRFTPDDRKITVVGYRNIVVYDAQTGTPLERQEDSESFAGGLPDHRMRYHQLASSARYGAFWLGNLEHDEGWRSSRNIWVLVRDIEKGKIIAKQEKIQEKYKNCSAAFTPDEDNLCLGSMDGYVRVWSLTGQKVIREWKANGVDEKVVPFEKMSHPYPIDSMIFAPDGRSLATMGRSKGASDIRIWDYSSGKLIHEFADVVSSSLAMCSGYPMAFSPDGKCFAFEQQGNLCLYDTQTWQQKWCVPSSSKN